MHIKKDQKFISVRILNGEEITTKSKPGFEIVYPRLEEMTPIFVTDG